jgi:parallel beta-helix repeat protein
MNSVRYSNLMIVAVALALASTPSAAMAKAVKAAPPVAGGPKTITVKPGQSIQDAVNRARPGDTVNVLSGDYLLASSQLEWDVDGGKKRCAAVLVHTPIRLMASGQVRIVSQQEAPSGDCQDLDGIVAEGSGMGPGQILDGVEVKGFVVQGFLNNGIKLRYVKNFNIENNVSADNLENGIWPTLSSYGQVKKNVAYGSQDSALWIEASDNVRVFNNDLATSPTGLEVTLSKDLVIENNSVHGNTVGIGLYHPAAAGLPQGLWPDAPYGNWQVANNHVYDNNKENTVQEGEVAMLPPGLGMLILGVQDVHVQQNWVEKNGFVGIAMLDWCVAAAVECFAIGQPEDAPQYPDTLPAGFSDTALRDVHVVANKLAGNHTATEKPVNVPDALWGLKSDILYVDGAVLSQLVEGLPSLPPGTGNCQSDNKLIKTPDPNSGPLIVAVPDLLFPTCP